MDSELSGVTPVLFEYLTGGLTLAWVTLAALLVLAGSRIRREHTFIRWWQWGVFYLAGLVLFAFVIGSYYIERTYVLLFFELLLILAAAALSAALWIHVRHSTFDRNPEEIVVESIEEYFR